MQQHTRPLTIAEKYELGLAATCDPKCTKADLRAIFSFLKRTEEVPSARIAA